MITINQLKIYLHANWVLRRFVTDYFELQDYYSVINIIFDLFNWSHYLLTDHLNFLKLSWLLRPGCLNSDHQLRIRYLLPYTGKDVVPTHRWWSLCCEVKRKSFSLCKNLSECATSHSLMRISWSIPHKTFAEKILPKPIRYSFYDGTKSIRSKILHALRFVVVVFADILSNTVLTLHRLAIINYC